MDINIKEILLTTGASTANGIGRQLGRLASTPSTDPTAPEVRIVRSALISGFFSGYFRREDGTMNWSVTLFPILIIVGIVVLIRKI
jgi:hypothetical protein